MEIFSTFEKAEKVARERMRTSNYEFNYAIVPIPKRQGHPEIIGWKAILHDEKNISSYI